MSSITWKENYLFQHVKDHKEELGYVKLDQNSNTYVLWLKDTFGVVLGTPGAYIRGDEFSSMAVAKRKAALSASAFIVHCIWTRNIVKQATVQSFDEYWDEISSELDGKANKDNLKDEISRHIDGLQKEEAVEWFEKIRDGFIVQMVVDFFKNLPSL